MRIFKNRGDIYFSKTNKKKSTEQTILIYALIGIVVFTVVFVVYLCVANDFSAKKFFAPENISTTAVDTPEQEIVDLPEVTGKNNFLILVYKEDSLLFANITQVDMESKAYKTSTLKASTKVDGKPLYAIFKQGGAANLEKALESCFGIEIDYYIAMLNTDFASFYDQMGDVNYPILNDIKYKNNNNKTGYYVKIKAGEQRISGAHFIDLIRYYMEVENSTSQANELFLSSLSQHNNSENYEKGEELFRDFVSTAQTNISVRDFNNAGEKLLVLCNDQTAMSVYNAEAKYKGNSIEKNSLKKVKGYFVK